MLNIAAENISESQLVAAVQRAAADALPRGCLDLQASQGGAGCDSLMPCHVLRMLPVIPSWLLCGDGKTRVQPACHAAAPVRAPTHLLAVHWLSTGCYLQDWAAAEELHRGSSSGEGSGHHAFYWELKEAAWATLQGAACCHGAGLLAGFTAVCRAMG